ncbi:DUF1617 family protein [Halolactibacillus sp. JCM 19043]|uniref:DUF1617 family protein n=1 Tax=Halolactibacillus sp. JCM 19043 TaxID=1460638 RepID=UPI0007863676|nr:DUF1617 family protein [Halolactibacillus sp. JCM 19043]
MQLKIDNIKLSGAIQILDRLELKGLKSVHRTRLIRLLSDKLKNVAEEEKKLKESYAAKDDEGKPIIIDDKYDIEETEKLQVDLEAFFNEKVVIDGGDNQVTIKSVKQSLEECDIDWSGQQAHDYANLYEAFEGGDE